VCPRPSTTTIPSPATFAVLNIVPGDEVAEAAPPVLPDVKFLLPELEQAPSRTTAAVGKAARASHARLERPSPVVAPIV